MDDRRPSRPVSGRKELRSVPKRNKRGREEKRFRRSVGTRRTERLRNVKPVKSALRALAMNRVG
jgi:hypothetical protein